MDAAAHLETADWWQALDDHQVECLLCAHRCHIAAGHYGRCGVRQNIEGVLKTLTYGRLCAAADDPIEKKPLYHFLPGSRSFSVATQGCNFRCDFCQNWQLSQSPLKHHAPEGRDTTAEAVVQGAQRSGCTSIAFTYSEPTIFMEWAADCARLARQAGLYTLFVSNGYQSPEALAEMQHWLNGMNIDLKAFSDSFYQQHCGAQLAPVLETIKTVSRETDIWLEVTTLLIPGQNDGDEELKAQCDWLVTEAGPHVPWHISRFFPQYRTQVSEATPMERLQKAYEIGKAAGLHYIYLGNVPGSQSENTHCHACGQCLIERSGYHILANHLEQGACPSCDTAMAGFGL